MHPATNTDRSYELDKKGDEDKNEDTESDKCKHKDAMTQI